MTAKWMIGLAALPFIGIPACGGESSDDAGSGTDDIISTAGFSTDCAIENSYEGTSYKGTLSGPFQVGKSGKLTSAKDGLALTMGKDGESKKWDFKLTAKSGVITDAENEVFEFVATDAKTKADITVKFDGKSSKATVSYPSIIPFKKKTLEFTATCKFKDSAGGETTNVKAAS